MLKWGTYTTKNIPCESNLWPFDLRHTTDGSATRKLIIVADRSGYLSPYRNVSSFSSEHEILFYDSAWGICSLSMRSVICLTLFSAINVRPLGRRFMTPFTDWFLGFEGCICNSISRRRRLCKEQPKIYINFFQTYKHIQGGYIFDPNLLLGNSLCILSLTHYFS